jgi:hypothetical protein
LTERSVSFVVVNANLHFERSKRRDTFISINEFGSFRGGHHFFLPATSPIGSESHNIAKAFPILKFFRHWLKKEKKTHTHMIISKMTVYKKPHFL